MYRIQVTVRRVTRWWLRTVIFTLSAIVLQRDDSVDTKVSCRSSTLRQLGGVGRDIKRCPVPEPCARWSIGIQQRYGQRFSSLGKIRPLQLGRNIRGCAEFFFNFSAISQIGGRQSKTWRVPQWFIRIWTWKARFVISSLMTICTGNHYLSPPHPRSPSPLPSITVVFYARENLPKGHLRTP